MKRIQLVSFLIVKNKSVLAEVRKSTDDFGPSAIWLPGGHIEKDETVEKAFFRELEEELEIQPKQYFYLCSLLWRKNKKEYMIHFFVCNLWKGKIKNNEAKKLIWINYKDITKLDENVDRKAFTKYIQTI